MFYRVWKINLNVKGLEDVEKSRIRCDAHAVQVVEGEPSDHPEARQTLTNGYLAFG